MNDEPNQNRKPQNAPPPPNKMVGVFVFILILAVYVAHQDSWNWAKSGPMVFGFLPPGLAYHAAYSIAAAAMMAVLVKFAWPKHLEEQEDKPRQ
jgi:protein-S-isoprenylcysteine O-methyltransferase Ste14